MRKEYGNSMPFCPVNYPLLCCSVVLASFFSTSVQAAFFQDFMIDPEDGMLDGSRYLSEIPLGFLPVPVLITEPAVGAGLGVMAIFFHESKEQRSQDTQAVMQKKKSILPENISVLGLAGTENGTKGIGGGHLGFWMDDRLRYKGFIGYPDINLDFYSLGGVPLNNGVELNLKGPALVQELKARVGHKGLFIGAWQMYRSVKIDLANRFTLPNAELNQQLNDFLDRHLDNSTVTSGIGPLIEYDSRDNPMSPQKGYNYLLRYVVFDDALGSDVDYDAFRFQGLNYWQLNEHFNLGLRLQYDGVDSGDNESLPSYVPPFIDLRGIPKNRYQGNHVAVIETELTWKMDFRWRFNGFVGTGRASDEFDELSSADAEDSFGVGFRYLIAKRYGFVMGADIARGPEETAFYIQAGSTW